MSIVHFCFNVLYRKLKYQSVILYYVGLKHMLANLLPFPSWFLFFLSYFWIRVAWLDFFSNVYLQKLIRLVAINSL